jgi:hypothetical protein
MGSNREYLATKKKILGAVDLINDALKDAKNKLAAMSKVTISDKTGYTIKLVELNTALSEKT